MPRILGSQDNVAGATRRTKARWRMGCRRLFSTSPFVKFRIRRLVKIQVPDGVEGLSEERTMPPREELHGDLSAKKFPEFVSFAKRLPSKTSPERLTVPQYEATPFYLLRPAKRPRDASRSGQKQLLAVLKSFP